MDIEWREPPKKFPGKGRNNGATKAFVDELKKHPGKWAAFRSFPKEDVKKTHGLRSYLTYKYQCEVTVRLEEDDKTVTLFARWSPQKRIARKT